METRPTLICIPDISGFTEFMSDTNIKLSSKVIPALLNKIIYANEIGLKVSEIEGDAVLFFRRGALPKFEDLINQCRIFFLEFYKQLHEIQVKHQKEADIKNVPKILGLKIILHYGKGVEATQIGKSIKLMGEDVIIAHRLLKNNIRDTEYLLLSEDLLNNYEAKDINKNFGWGMLNKGDEKYEHLGDINYSYISLSKLIE